MSGQSWGAAALFDTNYVENGTIRADEPCHVYFLRKKQFENIMQQHQGWMQEHRESARKSRTKLVCKNKTKLFFIM